MITIKLFWSELKKNHNGRFVVFVYRVGNLAKYTVKNPILKTLMLFLYFVFDRLVCRLLLNCEIPAKTQIGWGLHVIHPYGIVINHNCKIGDNVELMHQVTIGNSNGNYPIIGDDVKIGVGAKIMGRAQVGDNSIIGANAVVTKEFETNAILVGVPAQDIR